MQHLYPLELSCDADRNDSYQAEKDVTTESDKLNPNATEFRPKRNTTAIAELNVSDVIQYEREPPLVE